MILRPTIVPPTLVRDLPEPMWPLWATISPLFSHETGPANFLVKAPSAQTNILRSARHVGADGLIQIMAARQAGAIKAWTLDLIEASARLKMGDVQEALALLDGVSGDTDFAASLRMSFTRRSYPLMTQHPLWLLAHVAVEMGSGDKIFAKLLNMGLRTRSIEEPELASGVLLNTVSSGSWKVFAMLLNEGWGLSIADRGSLAGYLKRLADDLSRGPKEILKYDQEVNLGLNPLCNACERLGIDTKILKSFQDILDGKSKGRWRKAFISVVSPSSNNVSSRHLLVPKRTTGIQIRQPSE